MSDIITVAQVRQLKEMIHELGNGLTVDEYNAILNVFAKAVNRMVEEQGLN